MSSQPRLLVLTSTYPRWKGDSEPGFVHELSRRLTDHFEVTVVCPAAPMTPRREQMDGVNIRRFRYAPSRMQTLVNDGGIVTNLKQAPWKWALAPLFLLAEFWAVRKAIREVRPDVVHAHWLIPQGLVMAVLSTSSRHIPPFVITSHGADLYALRSWPMPSLKRFAARKAAALTVVSSAMREELIAQGIHHSGVRVEPMGVDLQTRFVPDDLVERSEDEILFVGRLVEKKGLRYLIESMPDILERHPSAFLTIAGFGPEKIALQRKAAELDVANRVHFLGTVPQDRLPDLYRRAAVFVAPFVEARGGDQEGLGLVTVEAIGCGCPVVVSDLSAVVDVVPDASFRVPPGDAHGLALAIVNQMSRRQSATCSQAEVLRKQILPKFDWSARTSAYAKLLASVARENG